MKLRNLLLAGLAVCTMASCSNDDDVNNGPIAEVDASLAFVATSDGLQTKADPVSGTPKEDFINKLDVYIFKADGSLANKKTVNAANGVSVSQVDHILVKVTPGADLDAATTNQFTAYFLANCDDIAATTLTTFEAAVAAQNVNSFGYEAATNYKYLPMAKKVTFTGLKPLVNSQGKYVENWIQNTGGNAVAGAAVDKANHDTGVSAPTSGYNNVVVERLVARIQVEKIEVDLSAINSTSSFKLTNLALANVHTDVTPTGTVFTKKLWAKGYQGPEYTSKDAVVAPYATAAPYNAAVTSLAKAYTYPSALALYDFNAEGADKFISYVYPNAGDDTFEYTKTTDDGTTSTEEATGHTLLLIAGYYKATTNSTPEMKHFRVKIDHDPTAAVDNKVVANYIYKLTVKITGEGSTNEDDYELNAHVAATISVAKWNVVEQTEDDAN